MKWKIHYFSFELGWNDKFLLLCFDNNKFDLQSIFLVVSVRFILIIMCVTLFSFLTLFVIIFLSCYYYCTPPLPLAICFPPTSQRQRQTCMPSFFRYSMTYHDKLLHFLLLQPSVAERHHPQQCTLGMLSQVRPRIWQLLPWLTGGHNMQTEKITAGKWRGKRRKHGHYESSLLLWWNNWYKNTRYQSSMTDSWHRQTVKWTPFYEEKEGQNMTQILGNKRNGQGSCLITTTRNKKQREQWQDIK